VSTPASASCQRIWPLTAAAIFASITASAFEGRLAGVDIGAGTPHHDAHRNDRTPREVCPMSEGLKIDTIRSSSTGLPGRALNSARNHHFILDSPSGPNEALTNGEAFLAGISSCGVTLIEKYAQEQRIPLRRMGVTIDGIRSLAAPNRFQQINMRFELDGVDQATADHLVEVWRDR
jgi:uncharacterized OsmC-like protein